MCHLWQWEFGNPSRNGYHNREWSDRMEDVGLIPSDTGKPGGKKTGQRMTHYIEENGVYFKAFQKMPKRYRLPFTAIDGEVMLSLIEGGKGDGKDNKSSRLRRLRPPSRKKTKYSCPNCGINVWGKEGLKIMCGEDGSQLEAVS